MDREKNIPMASVKSLLASSWQMFRAKIRTIIFVSLLSFLFSVAIAVLLESVDAIFANQANLAMVRHILVLLLLILLLYLAVRINIAISLVLSKNIKSIKEVWRISSKYILPFATTIFWLVLAFSLWLMISDDRLVAIFAIPVLALLILYSVVMWVFFVEDYQGQSAVRRSKELIRGSWLALILRLLFLFIPLFFFALLASLIGNERIVDTLMAIFNYFYTIFVLIYTYQVYVDLVKIKGHSQIEHSKYPTLTHVATIVIYIVMLVAAYIWIV